MLEGKTVGNLLGGVSQQPDSQRFANMAAESVNWWPSPVDGLKKRGGSRLIANILSGYPDANTRVHVVERDGEEWYAIVFAQLGGTWTTKVWDIHPDSPNFGQEVQLVDEAYAPAPNFLTTYMGGATVDSAETSLLTVGDTTFIANHKKEVALDAAVSAAQVPTGYITVRAGAYGQRYGVNIDNESYLVDYRRYNSSWGAGRTPPGDNQNQSKYISPEYIASEIQREIDLGPDARVWSATKDWPTTLHTWQYSINNASSGSYRLRLHYLDTGGVFYTYNQTTTIAYNANASTVRSALATMYGQLSNWAVTEKQPGGGVEAGFIVEFQPDATYQRAFLHMEVFDVSLGSTASPYATLARSNVIEISVTPPSDFEISANDAAKGVNVVVAKDEVVAMDQLPTVCRDGFRIAVQPDAEDGEGERFYVEFKRPTTGNPAMTFEEGGWEECIGFEVQTTIDPLTMPHVLVSHISEGEGGIPLGTPYFMVKPFTWDDRTAGDDTSNPAPGFFQQGKRITGLAYHRGRLCLLSGNSVTFSEAGQPGNLFRTTVAGGLVDSDRIDLEAQIPQPAAFRAGLELQESLLLFSDTTQVKVDSGGQPLTPKTAGLTVVSNYRCSPSARPVAAEYFGYFGFSRGDHAGVRQLWDASNGSASMYRATDITEQVTHYLGTDVEEMAVSTAVNALAVLSDDRSFIFMYRWEDSGQERVQSAWQKFQFHEDDRVRGIGFVGTFLVAAVERYNGSVDLEMIDMADGLVEGGLGWPVLLDRRVDESFPSSIVYDAPSDTTTVTMPATYTLRDGEEFVAVVTDGGDAGLQESAVATVDGQTVFALPGDLTGRTLVLGTTYVARHRLARVFLDGAASGKPTPEITGKTMVKCAVFDLEGTGYIRFEATRRAGDAPTQKVVSNYDPIRGMPSLRDEQVSVPLLARSDGYTLELVNDTPFPSRVISLEYELSHHTRSRRRGR